MCHPAPFEHVVDCSCVSNVFFVRQGYRHPSKVEFPAKHNFYFGKSSLRYQLFSCVHFVPREGFDFGNLSGYCRESEEWGAFKASCVVRVLEVNHEVKEIVDVKVDDSARVDWDINN
jgi:hypothetical protein